MSTTSKKHVFDAWISTAIVSKMHLKRSPRSAEALRKALVNSLPEDLSSYKSDVTKTRILEEFDNIFWKGRMDLVRDAVKAKFTAAKFHELLSKQPSDRGVPAKWVVEEKLKDMRGRSSAPREETATLPGILRVPFAKAPAYALKKTSFKKPFHALVESTSESFRVALISSPQLGLAYDDDIVMNLTRSGISAARKARCDALVISGGLLRLAWQKTVGPNRLLADLVTGTEIDIEAMAVNYRERATAIIESGGFEPIFVTALERFQDLLRGWYKVMMRPGKRPEFDGPVYIVLNPDELGLVRRMAYFELLYLQNQELHEAEAVTNVLATLAAEARKHLTDVRNGGGSRAAVVTAEKAHEERQSEARAAAHLASRMRMTNLDPTQNRRVYNQALSYLIAEIEKSMPHAKVIDQNSAYVVFGKSKHTIKFVSGGDSSNPYYDELGGYGPAQRRGELPSLTVVSHPRAVYMRKTSRENYLGGSMLGTVGFVEAPILVDKAPILERMRGTRGSLPIAKTVADSMFNGGMLVIKIDPEFGVTPDFMSAGTVLHLGAPKGAPPAPAKMLWLMVSTDMHFGGSMRVFLRRPSGLQIGLTEAVFELMQKSGLSKKGVAPVAGFFACDDVLHGNHFGTHKRPHYNWRPHAEIVAEHERALRSLSPTSGRSREEQLKKLHRELMDQVMFRPPDYLTGQFMELFHSLLRPYPDVFGGILLAAKEAGVVVRGVSDFTRGVQGDMRDVGLINFGSGNHATKTTDGMLHEGPIVAELLRAELRHYPGLAGMDLDYLVRAPLYQDQAIAYGTIRVGSGYEWGLHISGTPPRRDSWRDVLHGWVMVNRARGNPSTILDGKSIVHITGDKHFFAGAFAGGDVYVMGPSSTHTDGFAEIAGGLAENNAGVAFIGLPVEGPDTGEISVVHLTPTVVQNYLTSGEPFPWDTFLPNRV